LRRGAADTVKADVFRACLPSLKSGNTARSLALPNPPTCFPRFLLLLPRHPMIWCSTIFSWFARRAAARRAEPAGRISRTLGFIAFAGLIAASPIRLPAFPPAPYYTIYGVVRDQVGATLRVEGAQILLLRDSVEIGRAVIFPELRDDSNYELQIRVDQNRPSSRIYTSRSVAALGIYSLVVEMNGERFYPIEVSGTLRAGHGGERVRLDLNLGADTDHDGLPDVWEEWQLYQAGRVASASGWDLSLITRDGDFDGDGIGNYLEYVAGTFAGDATERFELILRTKTATAVAFEFFAITGKVYTIEQSSDLKTWAAAPFSLTPNGVTAIFHRAEAIDLQAAYVAITPGVARFYRLTVR